MSRDVPVLPFWDCVACCGETFWCLYYHAFHSYLLHVQVYCYDVFRATTSWHESLILLLIFNNLPCWNAFYIGLYFGRKLSQLSAKRRQNPLRRFSTDAFILHTRLRCGIDRYIEAYGSDSRLVSWSHFAIKLQTRNKIPAT